MADQGFTLRSSQLLLTSFLIIPPQSAARLMLWKTIGDFLRVVAAFMNWCEGSSPDSL
jgi:hypothetical protein